MRGYLTIAAVVFCGLVGVALAGAGPDTAAPKVAGCHGSAAPVAAAPAGCHGDDDAAAGCHGRTGAERRADRRSARADARADRAACRAERVAARGCHGAQAKASCHGAAQAKACECAEDCTCN